MRSRPLEGVANKLLFQPGKLRFQAAFLKFEPTLGSNLLVFELHAFAFTNDAQMRSF